MKIKSSVVRNKIEIENSAGEVLLSLPYTINIAKTASAVTKKQVEMAQASSDNPEQIGKSFIDLLTIIFGEENTSALLEFYEDDYLTMVTDLTPLLVDEIFPIFDGYREKALAAHKKVKRS